MLWSDGTTREEARQILVQAAIDDVEHALQMERDAAHDRREYESCFCYECQCRLHAMGAYDMDAE